MKKLTAILSLTLFLSCSKEFLDKRNLSQIGVETFWKDSADAMLALHGIYDALQPQQMYGGCLNANAGLPMYDNFGDNCYNFYKYEGPGNYMVALANPTTGMFQNLWSQSYVGIGRANYFIQNLNKVPAAELSDATRKQLLGQAYFLRAVFYMNLAIYFQDVPLVLTVQTLNDGYVPKNTYAEVAAQIEKDFIAAAEVLPNTYPAAQLGYATKGAALGLLTRLYMYNKEYQKALDATTTLLTLGYSLNASYPNLFLPTGETSSEIVFAVRFVNNSIQGGETFSSTFVTLPKVNQQPMPNLAKEFYCTDGKPITTSPLYNPANQKANRDPRFAANFYIVGDTYIAGQPVYQGGATPYGMRKYLRTTAVSGIAVSGAGSQDFYVLRYADVLLMRAEALIELNQLTPEVYTLINRVRQRVSMRTIETAEGTNLSQNALRQILRHERRVEFPFEGLRFYDLKRWGLVQEAFNRAIADNIAGYAPVFQGLKSEIFPVPQNEIDINTKMTQHPAWQ